MAEGILKSNINNLKNKLSIIEYNNKELNLAELIDVEDFNKVAEEFKKFGLTGYSYEFDTLYAGERVKPERLEIDSLDKISEQVRSLIDILENNKEDKAFKQGRIDVFTYLEPIDELKTGKLCIVYSLDIRKGQIASRSIQVINNENSREVLWTTDRIKVDTEESVKKLIEGLNRPEENEYSIKDETYDISVRLNGVELSEFEAFKITKNLVEE